MLYNQNLLPPAVQNKSDKSKKVFLTAYNSAKDRGLTEEECVFSGIASMNAIEKGSRRLSEPLKPKSPSHLSSVLEKRAVEASSPVAEGYVVREPMKKEFLGKNALPVESDRTLVAADFDDKNRLVLTFDTAEKIVTKPINIDETVQNYVSLSQTKTLGGFEPTGFVNRTTSQLSFNDTTRTFTINPVSEGYVLWLAGGEIYKNTTDTVQIPNTTDLYYIYFDSADSQLKVTSTFTSDLFLKHAMVSIVYWQVDQQKAIYFADERHGMQMDGATQSHLHLSIGTQYRTGLGLTSMIVNGNGSLSSHAQFGILDGRIADEDIEHTITNNAPQILASLGNFPVFYRLGAANNWYKTTADNYPLLLSGDSPSFTGATRPAFNSATLGVWSLAEVTNNKFLLVHILATNNINEPIIALLGNQYITKAEVNEAAKIELASLTGLPFAEFVPIATVIYEARDAYTNAVNARIVSTTEGGDYLDWRISSSLNITPLSGSLTTPAGLNTQVQYNDNGTFGASNTFTYNNTTDTLTVGHLNSAVFNTSSVGLVPASGGGTANFLRADGTFAAPPISTPVVVSTASVTSPLVWDSSAYVQYSLTGLANTLTINADANTAPADAQKMTFRIKDDGTARALTWTTGSSKSFRVIGATLPTTTVANKIVYVGCIYNAADARWDVVAVGQEV
jgi:hypothetical protein